MSLPRSPQHACNGLFQHTFDRSPPAWYSAGSHIQNSAKRHGGRAGDIACFIAPAGVAIVATIVQKVVKNKEEKLTSEHGPRVKGKWTQRLRWLNTMLWGGVALLALEHIWHGEVVPWPPFLTAMQTPGETGPMLHEILTYGLTMTAVILAVWGIMVGVAELRSRAQTSSKPDQKSIAGGA